MKKEAYIIVEYLSSIATKAGFPYYSFRENSMGTILVNFKDSDVESKPEIMMDIIRIEMDNVHIADWHNMDLSVLNVADPLFEESFLKLFKSCVEKLSCDLFT